jgi:hypothetical protein
VFIGTITAPAVTTDNSCYGLIEPCQSAFSTFVSHECLSTVLGTSASTCESSEHTLTICSTDISVLTLTANECLTGDIIATLCAEDHPVTFPNCDSPVQSYAYPLAIYPSTGVVGTTHQTPAFAIWYSEGLKVTGTHAITLVVQSSNTGVKPDLTLTLDTDNSTLVATGATLLYGGGQLLFDVLDADLTGYSGLTYTLSSSSTQSGWGQITDLAGHPIGTSITGTHLMVIA